MTHPRHRICLIEDDAIMGEALSDRFGLEGYACDWFKTGRAALNALGHARYDVAVCDVRLPDIDGETLFVELQAAESSIPPFIYVTGYGTIDRAVRLLKLGAHDYLTKPVDVPTLLESLRKVCTLAPRRSPPGSELGISAAMRSIDAMLPRLAESADSVLITGESGVGKEEVARALHRHHDPDGQKPFIAVNCGAITETLMEAELFGHVKGAFTGAVRDKKGYFEMAEGGTLFLDEIGEMLPSMQVKLLRAIQTRQISRVGAEHSVDLNIRLVCATHQDLKKMVENGRFRDDLYYRIHVVQVHIPPLRERQEDILWLARRMLDSRANQQDDRRTLNATAEQALLAYPWPGNVRELKHCLDRACIMSRKRVLTAQALFDDTPPVAIEPEPNPESLSTFLQDCERNYIAERLRAHDGRIIETAVSLGISRKNLWEKMKRLNISSGA